MGCCASCCAKCCLSLCNTLVIFIGTILMLLGAFLLWGWGTIVGFLGPMLNSLTSQYNLNINSINPSNFLSIISNVGWALFIVGIILMAIGVLGYASVCCSCCKVCSIIYIVILAAFLLAEVIFIIIYFAAQPTFASMAKTYMLQLIQQYYVDVWQLTNNFNVVAFLYNLMMVNLKCCGVNNYTDYLQSSSWNRTYAYNSTYNVTMQIPYACCVMTSTSSYTATYSNCTTNPTTSSAYLTSSCYTALSNSLANYLTIVIAVFGGLGALLLIPIALTVCICTSKASVGPS